MIEDMTFCMDECKHKVCFRHPSHIKHPEWMHSYAHLKGTDECIIYGDIKPLKVGGKAWENTDASRQR